MEKAFAISAILRKVLAILTIGIDVHALVLSATMEEEGSDGPAEREVFLPIKVREHELPAAQEEQRGPAVIQGLLVVRGVENGVRRVLGWRQN